MLKKITTWIKNLFSKKVTVEKIAENFKKLEVNREKFKNAFTTKKMVRDAYLKSKGYVRRTSNY